LNEHVVTNTRRLWLVQMCRSTACLK